MDLYAHAQNARSCDIFEHRIHCDAFLTLFDHPHEYALYFDEFRLYFALYFDPHRMSVDGRPKRIEMYTFSNENALLWTGL